MLPPAMVYPVATTTADVTVFTGCVLLRGWAFVETTGAAAAAFVIYDGAAAAGQIVAPITLAANESTRDYPPGDGIILRTSAFIDVTAGSVQGALWLTPISHAEDVDFAFGQHGPYFVHAGT